MGGTCPSRARAVAVGGWYRDGHKWVHVQNTLVITDGCTDGLRGSGRMSTADVMVVYFDHRPHVGLDGHIQPNGDIEWDNNIKWVRHEAYGQPLSRALAHGRRRRPGECNGP